ncbi:MAG: DoxX family protein [Ilumatobacteraceae bacterium]
MTSTQLDLAVLILRLVFGLTMVAHGLNKLSGSGGLSGTAGWFGSMGFKYPMMQARVAAGTEIGAGALLAMGLLTSLAAAGFIGLMLVAIYTAHLSNGFFIFRPGRGWEYASIAAAALAIGTIGAGRWSLDEAFDLHASGWTGFLVALLVGVGGAVAQLAAFYRPRPRPDTAWRSLHPRLPTPQGRPTAGRRALVVFLGLVIALMLVMWVYALFFASKEKINRVSDRDWAERSEQICADARLELYGLADYRKLDEVGGDALAQRADIVEQANTILRQMVVDVGNVAYSSDKAGRVIPLWLADWNTYLDDRDAYVAQLRTGDGGGFAETMVDGSPISKFITDFAVDNSMKSCQDPLDLAT